MSTVLRMIDKNIRLSDADDELRKLGDGTHQAVYRQHKSPEKYAQAIFAQLCHPKVQDLVAMDFANLPQQVRIELRTLCNDGNGSGNVRKGVQRLNQLLRGELLREEQRIRINVRVETAYGVGYKQKPVNPAIAGAAKKYGTR